MEGKITRSAARRKLEASENTKLDDDIPIGSYVKKSVRRVLLGKVVSYDGESKLFKVFYEDGISEDLGAAEVRKILFGGGMKVRKRKLDELVDSESGKKQKSGLEVGQSDSDVSEDPADSSIDSNEEEGVGVVMPVPVPVVEFPESSGDISVPEECVEYLFSVYNFLRSFSIQLFLSPFGLDDFVGSLNCMVQNSLLDGVHVALMRALKRHLEMLSSEGSGIATKCLRHHDWSLLDNLTWPAILVDYLHMMGYGKGLDEKDFNFGLFGGEYYALPVSVKLKVLQVLCDEVIDSAELRAELEMRENMEEENEGNVSADVPVGSGPRRLHPRYAKTSACKDSEGLDFKASKPDADASDADQDGNSDECRLCGMDGILICCDGCPSAYHTRCIGLNKAFLPDGLWLCRECTANKLGKTSSRIGRGTSGAEIFGTDQSGRMFLGTCNYLLMIMTSSNSEPVTRYYNQGDVTKVLSVLSSTAEIASTYADISRAISTYWEIPLVTVHSVKPEPIRDAMVCNEPGIRCIPQSMTSSKWTTDEFNNADGKDNVTKLAEENLDNEAVVCQKDDWTQAKVHGSTLELVDKASHDMCTNKSQEPDNSTLLPVKKEEVASEHGTITVQKPSPFMDRMSSRQLGDKSLLTELSYSNKPKSGDKLIVSDNATCGSGNENDICTDDAGSTNFSTKTKSVSISYESRLQCHISDERHKIKSQKRSNVLSLFKPHAYINHYTQGDVAASAAANLAVLESEESKVSEARASSNTKITVAAKTTLQLKAFSGATISFLWPNYEKKPVEIPRERCGWCISCRGVSTWKRGCLLNVASIHAVKRSTKNLCSLRPIKQVESHIPIIAAQLALLEENLRGLIVGPFLDVEYNKKWHKLGKEASSCRMLKFLLLELEKNIRGIAFSECWSRPVDDWLLESSAISGPCITGPSQKHRPGGRRRKQSVASELERDSSSNSWKIVQWWRGGKFSKVVFQKGALPSSLVKKAGRQGGIRRISGINYPEGTEFPRRSRQFAWRASVEMSKNESQIALQVRYLDAQIRWRDLVRPEQSSLDDKGSDVDAMAFRNAVICDKRIAENKIIYALTFSTRKHLSSRVMKNVLESEKLEDGSEKLWFSENHIPLYLVKEYEENVDVRPLPCSFMLKSPSLPRPRRRQLKGWGSIFSYLLHKGDKPSIYSCASCQQDVFLRDSVRCSTCEGHCHKDCAIPSTNVMEDDVEFLFTCNSCRHAKSTALNARSQEALSRHQSLQGQNQQLVGAKCILETGHHNNVKSVGSKKAKSKRNTSDSSFKYEPKAGSPYSVLWGLIWKRKKGEECISAEDFRMQNILLKCTEGIEPAKQPECGLCKNPYRSDLMYICCEKCSKWYHADAHELEESQIFDLLGFKCCKCRSKRQPVCPYQDNPRFKKPVVPIIAERSKVTLCDGNSVTLVSDSKADDFVILDDDPLLNSVGKVEQIRKQSVDMETQLDRPGTVSRGQQKLSVRRPKAKHENDANTLYATQNVCGSNSEEALTNEETKLVSASGNLSSTQVKLDSSKNCGYDNMAVDNIDILDQLHDPEELGLTEDMKFEPQTYFSFTELLASEDGSMENPNDVPMDISETWSFDDPEIWSFDDPETISVDVPHDFAGSYEAESGNQLAAANGASLSGVACDKCKLNEPSPDLMCDMCGTSIHSHCSPWVEIEEPSGAPWRCGCCREWR